VSTAPPRLAGGVEKIPGELISIFLDVLSEYEGHFLQEVVELHVSGVVV